jgi:hypothetical protein
MKVNLYLRFEMATLRTTPLVEDETSAKTRLSSLAGRQEEKSPG